MTRFIARLREFCGGKPVGLKLCIGHAWEFLGLCKAMVESGIYPDFIVVGGKEGSAGAAPLEFTDRLDMPLREGLVFVRDALIGIGARDRIRIGCSGKIVKAFDMVALALGDDRRRTLPHAGQRPLIGALNPPFREQWDMACGASFAIAM
jgi:glutamate synthase domain-containing protein 2